jgi:hypothetical protein
MFERRGDLLPGQWCGNGGLFLRAEGIGADGCLVLIILTPIDKDFSFPQIPGHF